MTLNSVAVKLEFAWQGFKDSDSMSLIDDAKGVRENMVVKDSHAGFDNDERRMMIYAQVEDPSVQGVNVQALGCGFLRLGCAAAPGSEEAAMAKRCFCELSAIQFEVVKEGNVVIVDGVRRNWRLSLQRPKIETRKLNEWQGGWTGGTMGDPKSLLDRSFDLSLTKPWIW